jgi:hypothetical protein
MNSEHSIITLMSQDLVASSTDGLLSNSESIGCARGLSR